MVAGDERRAGVHRGQAAEVVEPIERENAGAVPGDSAVVITRASPCQDQKVSEARRLEAVVLALPYLEVRPGFAGKQRGVLAPETGRPVFVGDIHVLKPLGLDQEMRPFLGDDHKVGFVVAQVAGGVGVVDGEAELLR